MNKNNGKIHFYTGGGKGKTTAAVGLAVRAAGAGKRVFFAQFVKGMEYSEISVLRGIENIDVSIYGRDCFIGKEPEQDDIAAAQEGLRTVATTLRSGKHDMVILDEIFIALHYNLIERQQLIDLLKTKPTNTELILTGRYAPLELYPLADLITEMKEVKHYYSEGVLSRKGIDC